MNIRLGAALGAVLQCFFATCTSQSLPYNPTTILLPSNSAENKDVAYVFVPSSETSAQHQLSSLNISSIISASNLNLTTITSNLPFLGDDSIAFIPSISSAGEIAVYAGSCSTSSSSALWIFTPSNTSITGNGTWTQQKTSTASDVTSADLPGADFLSAGFSFSPLVQTNSSQTAIYVFGGMCPTSGAAETDWQSAASYSNHMLRLAPSSSSTTSSLSFTLDLPLSAGPPIAEAGFTITGLTPTYSNSSGVMTQQQNFVLLGGHTQTAFINMSQIAVWSLPEETWSFVTVDSPSTSNANTELAVKSTDISVDSRSGHTAVMTEDGSRIIVYGGWVGDVTQAAVPQLAILELGTGFGGNGDWVWYVPSEQPSGTGIYGHGAAMLPGNMMMILGGVNISSSSSTKRDKVSTQAMFFNATSMSWTSNYTNPNYVAGGAKSGTHSSSSHNSNKEIGLGVGLGLGFAAILGALVIYICYSRRLKRRREEGREKHLRDLSVGAAHYYASPREERGRRSGGFPWDDDRWNNSNIDRDGYSFDATSAVAGYENLRRGVHGDIGDVPSPTMRNIPRKPLHSRGARGLYQPAPIFDLSASNSHGRSNSLGTAGPIHPIYEADEDADHLSHSNAGVAGTNIGTGELSSSVPGSSRPNRYSDPFKDPPQANFVTTTRRDNRSVSTPSPESPAQEREREIQEWVSDWAAADALLNSQTRSHSNAGRLSPTRRAQLIAASQAGSVYGEDDSGRTASNLSERSIAPSVITISRSGSSSQGTRNNSLRGLLSTAMNPFTSTILTTTVGSTNVSPVFDSPGPHGPRPYQPPGSSGSGNSSFNTAHTSFPTLRAEGEGLLPRPDEFSGSGEQSPTRSLGERSGSPSKSKASALGKGRTQMGWLGSLRKVFTGDSGASNHSPESFSFSSREDSPTRINTGAAGAEPRRTVSAGATLWRRKQGKGDWEDSAARNQAGRPDLQQRSNTFTGDAPMLQLDQRDSDEWDIERAVENRVVQVMFTVPKEKLRVVNHDVDEDKSDVGSLKSKKGSLTELNLPVTVVEEASTPGKGKGRVLEMVEKMEGRNSPQRR